MILSPNTKIMTNTFFWYTTLHILWSVLKKKWKSLLNDVPWYMVWFLKSKQLLKIGTKIYYEKYSESHDGSENNTIYTIFHLKYVTCYYFLEEAASSQMWHYFRSIGRHHFCWYSNFQVPSTVNHPVYIYFDH